MKQLLLPALALALLTQCRKSAPDPAKPEDQLPPATQTGANTFGCLVNGQPYTPNGNNGTSNYTVLYDPTFQGGSLDVLVYAYAPNSSSAQYLSFGGSSISFIGTYPITGQNLIAARYSDAGRIRGCTRYASDNGITTCKGGFTITRLDGQAGIISGTFAFTFSINGCDTIKVTQGRFDKKL